MRAAHVVTTRGDIVILGVRRRVLGLGCHCLASAVEHAVAAGDATATSPSACLAQGHSSDEQYIRHWQYDTNTVTTISMKPGRWYSSSLTLEDGRVRRVGRGGGGTRLHLAAAARGLALPPERTLTQPRRSHPRRSWLWAAAPSRGMPATSRCDARGEEELQVCVGRGVR